jgi:hypothetical protein
MSTFLDRMVARLSDPAGAPPGAVRPRPMSRFESSADGRQPSRWVEHVHSTATITEDRHADERVATASSPPRSWRPAGERPTTPAAPPLTQALAEAAAPTPTPHPVRPAGRVPSLPPAPVAQHTPGPAPRTTPGPALRAPSRPAPHSRTPQPAPAPAPAPKPARRPAVQAPPPHRDDTSAPGTPGTPGSPPAAPQRVDTLAHALAEAGVTVPRPPDPAPAVTAYPDASDPFPAASVPPAGRRRRAGSAAPPAPNPTVEITIGRIELRTVAPVAEKPAAGSAEPSVTTLDDYLRRRARPR